MTRKDRELAIQIADQFEEVLQDRRKQCVNIYRSHMRAVMNVLNEAFKKIPDKKAKT